MKRAFLFVTMSFLLPDSVINAETSRLIEKTVFTSPDLYPAAVKTFSILFIILAVILTAFYVLKRFWPRGLEFMGSAQWIKVIAATSIAPKKMVALVEVAGEILVLGLTGDQITMLTKVTDGKMVHRLKESQAKKIASSPFYRNFKSLIHRCVYEGEKSESLIHKIAGPSGKDDQRIEEINIPGIET